MTFDLPKMSTEERILRQLVATGHGKIGMYTDDGEMQCNVVNPCIDFMRDTPQEIERKIMERNHKVLATFCHEEYDWIEP